MSFTAEVYKVMIASPSDVVQERAAVRQILHEWNDVHSAFRKIVLLPLGWETNATPQMGATPQSIINKQILGDADILVGVFWTRLGTSTAEYESGTVEEIKRHIDSGKIAKLYFSDTPVQLGSVEPEQYAALQKFKKECQQGGLLETFSGIDDFRSKFMRHLQIEMNNGDYADLPAHRVTIAMPPHGELSAQAATLLRAAANDQNGQILHSRTLDGDSIQTNGEDFIEDDSPRSSAIWIQAIEDLVERDFIQDQGYDGQVYRVKQSGYQEAERLERLTPLNVEIGISGKLHQQVISIQANRSISVDRVSYAFSNSGAVVASEDMSQKGKVLSIPLNNDMLLKLWNAPRPDKAYSDHSGPATLALKISSEKGSVELVLPVLLESIMQNSAMYRQVTGRKSYSF